MSDADKRVGARAKPAPGKRSEPAPVKRGFANVVRRGPSIAGDARPAPKRGVAHVIARKGSQRMSEDSAVLLPPKNITLPMSNALPSSNGASRVGALQTNSSDDYTIEEGRPQPPRTPLDNANDPAADPNQGFLVVSSGKDLGRRVALIEGRTTIGRGLENDVVLTDMAVSRRHLYIERRDTVYFVCDLSSGNGTFVNERERSGEVLIVNGDTFRIGKTIVSFAGPEDQQQEDLGPTTNWQPEQEADSAEEATVVVESVVAGKEILPKLDESFDEPFSQVQTSVVFSADFASDQDKPKRKSPPPRKHAQSQPPPIPPPRISAQQAAIPAISSIDATPPPPLQSSVVHPLETGDLRGLGIPPTPGPTVPYPVQAPAAFRTTEGVAAPPSARPTVPNRPIVSREARPSVIPLSPKPPAQNLRAMGLARPMLPSAGLEQIAMAHGAGAMPGQPVQAPMGYSGPMMQYSPAMLPGHHSGEMPSYSYESESYPTANRGKLLIGIIGVALVLVAVGIVAGIMRQNRKDSVAGSVPDVLEISPGSESDTIRVTPLDDTSTKPLVLANLIAGTTSMPASTWGTDESFLAGAPSITPLVEPIIPGATDLIVEPIETKEKDEAAIKTPTTDKDRGKAKVTSAAPGKKATSTRSPDRDEGGNDSASSGSAVGKGATAAKAEAKDLYKRRRFNEAAELLDRAADRADDRSADELMDLARGFREMGKLLASAEGGQNSDPTSALASYKQALAKDKRVGDATHAKLIRLRIGQVAPKAAKSFMAKNNLADAKKAADDAARYGEGAAVKAVYGSLERKADGYIKKALAAKKNGDDDKAKVLLLDAIKIAPKNTEAYELSRTEIRKL